MKKVLLLFSIACTFQTALSQCPASSFVIPSQGCLNENIRVSGTPAADVSYEWDFCAGDLTNNLDLVGSQTLSSTNPFHADLVMDGAIYRAFICDASTQKLIRLDYFSGIKNAPVASAVNLNISLNNPRTVRLVQDGQLWYGLLVDLGQSKVYRLTFGTDLTSSPLVEDLNVPGLSTPQDLDIVKDGNNFVAVIANFGNNSITRVIFGGSMNSTPSALNDAITGSNPLSISLHKVCDSWYGFMTLASADDVTRISFGISLSGTLTSNMLSVTAPGFTNLRGVTSAYEAGDFYVFVSSESGKLFRFDFGPNPNLVPTNTFVGMLSQTATTTAWGIEIYKDQSDWYMYLLNYSGHLDFFKFQSNCLSSPAISLSPNPAFSYSSSGTQTISLSATDASGNHSTSGSSINVQPVQAPSIDFAYQNNSCTGVAMTFESSSDISLVSSAWDFDDGGTSSSPNPTHTYLAAASYHPLLTVTASNGCQNSLVKSLDIFNPPQASFTLPIVSPFCTNQNYIYLNTSTYDNGSNPTWQWSVNGSIVSTTQNLNYLFSSSSAQSITLTSSIPGCSSQSTQNISSLTPGPLVTFDVQSIGCEGSPIPFTNTTASPVTTFSWTFGDGNTLDTPSPSNTTNTYASTGQYQVTLNATNAAGCQNSLSKNINIYSSPQPSFNIEAPPLSCEKWPAQFDNNTPPLVDSNITSWQWSFADALNGSSTQKNPAYTYNNAGNYNVTLQAKSNFGCTGSFQKTVTIFSSPQALFNDSPACVNQNTQFTDKSTGNISTYQWSIDGNTVSSPNPIYSFKTPGNYPVVLTVTATNGCVSQFPKTINVPIVPNLDFSVLAPCTGHPTTFQELNPNGADPTTSWNWSFGQGSGTNSPVSFSFPSAGTYPVTMTTTRQSGCAYSFSKSVTIYDGPVASFSPSVLAGAAPLAVTFVNNSPAESSSWDFGDQSAPVNAISPSHTFSSLGAYKVLLTAKSHATCTDTVSTVINVVIPHIDIVMTSFSLTSDPSSNTSKPVVNILNSGNIPLVDPEVVIDLGGGVLLKEKVPGLLKPGKSIIQTLDVQIVPQAIQYVCAEIDVADDVNLANNKQCVSLSREDVVMNPYPNPSSSGQVTLQWIGATQENVRVTIYKSNGDVAFVQNLDGRQSGLGQLTINTSSFANGLYLIQFVGDKITKTFRIVIAN